MKRVALLLVVVAAAITVTAAYAAQSPKAELAAIRHAALSQHSVHYVSVSSAPGHKIRLVSDVGNGVGIQRITVTDQGQTGPATVVVSRRTAYLRGNVFTMRAYFGFSTAQATKYAGQWISIPHTSPGFATVSADATFASYVAYLFPQTKLSLVTAGSLVGVRGTARQQGATFEETVFAPAHGKPLPAKETATSTGRPGTGVTTMSRWNEAVHVGAPSSSVPISTVVGG
jgi:hypothetical protein